MEGEARMAVEPLAHLGMLVGGVVVEDHVDRLAGGHLALRSALRKRMNSWWRWRCMLRPMTVPVEHVEGGKQRGRAVPLVVVGHGAGAPLLHRQAGLGAVERLDLALLVDRQHDRRGPAEST